MNIEEDLTSLKEIVAIRKERCHGFIESDSCLISTKRLETLLTAYEKEKELLELASNMLDNIDYDQIPIAIGELKSELEKEKEKVESFEYALSNGEVTTINNFDNNVPTKLIGSYTYGKEVVNFIKRNFVSKNKIKQIIYPTPNRPIPIEIQQSEMYKKLVKEVEE